MSKPSLIAIVDDDEAMRDALFDLLQVEGLSARTFGDAESFLACVVIDAFDCVITDVRMPGIDGLELQRRLRALGLSTPVIFVTSAEDKASRAQAMADGATAYLPKPLASTELLHELSIALHRQPG